MTQNNTQDIHSLCTEQADAFAAADDLLPQTFRGNYDRILTACYIAHALDMNPAAVMFGKHLKKQPKAAHQAEKPEATEVKIEINSDGDIPTWPRKIDGVWTDSAGTIYDKAEHGWNKSTKMPSVKADGTFRSARRAAKVKTETASNHEEKTTAHNDEQALVESNQVLASFKSHVADATTNERLEQIGAQIELMGFTPSELTIARRWIAERAESIEK